MEDFDKDEVIQLLNYYKNRSADLEFQLLQTQLKMKRASLSEPVAAKKTVVEKTK